MLLAELEDSDAAIGTLEEVLFSSALLEEESMMMMMKRLVLFSSALLEEESDDDDDGFGALHQHYLSPRWFNSKFRQRTKYTSLF
ncbi:MAG: hypothetical protein P0116_06540 [Candidatus Nitrosocosmicus sp.]|nr:hypothetical protein [Candidatus Nitrosocosmicus sp.]